LNENDSYSRARGRRDLRRRPPRETNKRPGQMGLIRVPGLTRHVGRGHAPAQQLDRPFGPPDLPDGPAGQARWPAILVVAPSASTDLQRPPPMPLHDRIMHQQSGPDKPVDEDIGVVRPRELPSGPIEPERCPRGPRQRQRTVNQLSGRQARHERAQAELDPEKLRIPRDRRRRCLRLGSSHREPGYPPLTRDDDLPMTHRHRDEGLLGLTSCLPRLLDQRRA
jgi:hypothetical protein